MMKEMRCHSGNSQNELIVSVEPEEEKWAEDELNKEQRFIRTLKRKRSRPLEYEVGIEGKKIVMECDAGAVVTVMSFEEYKEKFSHLKLHDINPEDITLYVLFQVKD